MASSNRFDQISSSRNHIRRHHFEQLFNSIQTIVETITSGAFLGFVAHQIDDASKIGRSLPPSCARRWKTRFGKRLPPVRFAANIRSPPPLGTNGERGTLHAVLRAVDSPRLAAGSFVGPFDTYFRIPDRASFMPRPHLETSLSKRSFENKGRIGRVSCCERQHPVELSAKIKIRTLEPGY